MPSRDFFVFCTSLSPTELRAVGTLSQVRHLGKGETIYPAGDPADEFFIISRGIIHLVPAAAKGVAAYLKRGDIFGDIEVLTDRTRLDRATAQEAASLQCFGREQLPELVRQVPSFCRFLCEDLARRLIKSRDPADLPDNGLELSGNLLNFDLVAVYQTIMQSTQTGVLNIVSDSGESIAKLHFADGQPISGRFQHLTGEDAFWQLFLADDLRGTFSFSSTAQAALPGVRSINRPANDMLFAAMQFWDEFQALKVELPPSSVYEKREPDFLAKPSKRAISAIAMAEVRRCFSERKRAISDLFPACTVCELKIFQAVQELVRTGHLGLAGAAKPQSVV